MKKVKMIRWISYGLAAFLLIMLVAYWLQSQHHTSSQQLEQEYADKLGIHKVDQEKPASDFVLSDQRGKNIKLSSMKGKAVLLQFMDPVCEDICPIVSQETLQANKLLEEKSDQVEYIAVNVNEYHLSNQDTLAFSQKEGLESLPNWHFVSGSKADLKQVWKDYGIAVVPNSDGDVQHTSIMYFIDKQGNVKYAGFTDQEAASIAEWSKGIAFFAQQLM